MENMKTVLENGPFVSCVKRTSYLECIKAIWVSYCFLKGSGRKSILPLLFCHFGTTLYSQVGG